MNSDNPFDLALAPEVFFTVWLNLWRNKMVPLSDVAYAGAELFGTEHVGDSSAEASWKDWLANLAPGSHPFLLAWPTTGDPAGLPRTVNGPAIAISPSAVLCGGQIVDAPNHRVHNETAKFAIARQSSLVHEVLGVATRELTSGDREAMDLLLSQMHTSRLPRQTPGTVLKSLETSSTIRAIGLLAHSHIEVVSSRSANEQLRSQFKELIRACELAMCAVVSNI